MGSAENYAYQDLMQAIKPGASKVAPTSEYAKLMRRESAAARILAVNMSIPGVIREPDWVDVILARMNAPKSESYRNYMRLRQKAFAASTTVLHAIVAASGIEALAQVQGVRSDFAPRQLRRMEVLRQAGRYVMHVVPTDTVCKHLDGNDNRIVFFGTDPSPPVYEEFPPETPSAPHERWHAAGSAEAKRFAEAQQALFRELTGDQL